MLHEALSQYQRADGHFLKAAGHTGVEDHIGPVERDEQLGRHGGIDLAHTAAAGDNILTNMVKRDTGHRLQQVCALLRQQALYFAGHGIHQTDFHRVSSPLRFSVYCTDFLPQKSRGTGKFAISAKI